MHIVLKAGRWNNDLKKRKDQNDHFSVADPGQGQCMEERWYRPQTHEWDGMIWMMKRSMQFSKLFIPLRMEKKWSIIVR